jgi:phosphatidylserine synthase
MVFLHVCFKVSSPVGLQLDLILVDMVTSGVVPAGAMYHM